jgi:hypothetical protein
MQIPNFNNDIEQREIGIKKFETCQNRSKDLIQKKSCCGGAIMEFYACLARDIFPLSYLKDCTECNKYKNIL